MLSLWLFVHMSTSFSIWFLCFFIYLTKEKNSQECITYSHNALAIDIVEIKCFHIIELKPHSVGIVH